MKRINTFLILQYIGLVGTISVPLILGSYFSQEIKELIPGLACIFLALLTFLILAASIITEIICVKNAKSKSKNDTDRLFKIWKRLKFCTIPFYVISFAAYIIIAPITFPMSIIIIPLEALFCEITIIISGIAGIHSIKAIKKRHKRINSIHYLLQVLPVFDVLSTLILKNKTK